MENIKIGDSVICIKDTNWSNEKGLPLIYKSKYKVLDIIKCSICGKLWYDIGCKRNYSESHSKCCEPLSGAGIDWVDESRLKPYVFIFKEFVEHEVIEIMIENVKSLVKEEKYEKAIDIIKRIDKIKNEWK